MTVDPELYALLL
jgi:hypothetical protein